MFGHPRRGGWQATARRRCPQQSTAFVGPSQNSRNLGEIIGVPHFNSTNERVSCICQLVISRTVCPSVFRSEPLMWSRDVAGKKGICAYFRAMWSCRAGGASILRTILAAISPVPRRPGLAAAARRPQRNPSPGKERRPQGEKNYGSGRNHAPTPPLTVRRRAKPPSPSPSITRRRTPVALAAGVHLFWAPRARSAAALFPADDQIVAMDHLGPAGKAEDRVDIGGRAASDLLRILGVIGA